MQSFYRGVEPNSRSSVVHQLYVVEETRCAASASNYYVVKQAHFVQHSALYGAKSVFAALGKEGINRGVEEILDIVVEINKLQAGNSRQRSPES